MIECTRCGSTNTRSLTRSGSHKPRRVRGVVIRQHSCRECGQSFRSYQLTIDNRLAADLVADFLEGVA